VVVVVVVIAVVVAVVVVSGADLCSYWRKDETNYDQGCAKNCILALDSPVMCWLNPCCGVSRQHIRRNFDASQ
jgi:hypothetical protein